MVFSAIGQTPGVMVDVGAHYGFSLAPFAEAGWSVHAFEPDPTNRAELMKGPGSRANVTVVPKGVSDELGSLPLYVSPESSGVSSLAPFTDAHQPTATVDITTLASYVAEAGIATIDFLKIDVEGFERNVLRGHDWSIKPRVMVIEFEDSKTVPLGYSWRDLADEVVGHGYTILVSEWAPIVQYGQAHTWRRFVRYPTALLDDAAWGNFIAVQGDIEPFERAARVAARKLRIRSQVERVLRR